MGVKVQDFLIENRAELLGAVEEAERYGSIAARQTKKERDREYYCKYYAQPEVRERNCERMR